MGVWVEMIGTSLSGLALGMSLPSWECGLKFAGCIAIMKHEKQEKDQYGMMHFKEY